MPFFKCRDLGMDCKFEAEAETEDELMKKIAKHAREAHGMETISSDQLTAVKKAIKK